MSFSNGPPTESNLVIQAQAGNEAAFEKLYTQYYDRIRVYLARRIGDNGIGCELAQEVFLKAWRGLPDLRDPSFIDHWLYRIATNEANDHQRRARHENWEYYEKEPKKLKQLSVDGPEEEALAKELLMRALARVSPKYRECLILYHVKGVPKQKIAERLQIKESSVTTYISNGLEEFRQAYAHLSAEHNTPGKER